jgi:type II secretory pathway pseudopilin PulG
MDFTLKNMSTEKGFTLVESLVAGSIAAIIGVGMVSIIYMVGQQVSESSRNLKLLSEYDIVVAQIGRDAHNASAVLADLETYPPGNLAAVDTPTIYMFNKNVSKTIPVAGYKITGTPPTLQYLTPPSTWNDFKILSSDPAVQVTAASDFRLASNRTSVTLNLNVVITYKGKTETVTSSQELFTCRNVN